MSPEFSVLVVVARRTRARGSVSEQAARSAAASSASPKALTPGFYSLGVLLYFFGTGTRLRPRSSVLMWGGTHSA